MQQTKQATLEFVLHGQDVDARHSGFTGLGTETARDWPRPPDDPHAGQFAFADPLFAAWGRAG